MLPCVIVDIDTGIGSYEYWGFKGKDVHWNVVTNCCESKEFVEGDFTLIGIERKNSGDDIVEEDNEYRYSKIDPETDYFEFTYMSASKDRFKILKKEDTWLVEYHKNNNPETI
jgi:hypothetical protein